LQNASPLVSKKNCQLLFKRQISNSSNPINCSETSDSSEDQMDIEQSFFEENEAPDEFDIICDILEIISQEYNSKRSLSVLVLAIIK